MKDLKKEVYEKEKKERIREEWGRRKVQGRKREGMEKIKSRVKKKRRKGKV